MKRSPIAKAKMVTWCTQVSRAKTVVACAMVSMADDHGIRHIYRLSPIVVMASVLKISIHILVLS